MSESFLKEASEKLFNYDCETGEIRWAAKVPRSKTKIGDIAGSVMRDGYRRVIVHGKFVLAHRLAWLMYYGKFPENEIDHINRNRADNRICNLREATRSQNCMNRNNRYREASSRYYTKHKSGKFQVCVKGRYIGLFETERDATKIVLEVLKNDAD
jgi:hypothetical protein